MIAFIGRYYLYETKLKTRFKSDDDSIIKEV